MEAMKTKIKFKSWTILWTVLFVIGNVTAQKDDLESGMKIIANEVIVNSPPEDVWQALASFGNVSSFLSTIDEGAALNGSLNHAVIGAERESIIPQGINNIIQKERIIELMEGVFYTYDVYESESLPVKKMFITYGIKLDEEGKTVLYSIIRYKMNSSLKTRMLKGKLDKGNMDSLIAYKYYVETGEENRNIEVLRKQYNRSYQKEPDHDLIATNVSHN
jgi:hypothetical protein